MESEFMPHGHAAEFGTSVMLHLAPEHVQVDRAVVAPNANPDAWPDVHRTRSRVAQNDTGVLGDATVGTAEKGEEVLRRAVERAVAFLTSGEFASPKD